MKRSLPPWAFYAIALGVVALDQAVKAWTIAALPVGAIYPLWPGVFQFMHTQNRGMAFSLLDGTPYAILFLACAALIVVGAIVYAERRMAGKLSPILALSLALPMGGAVGNLIDRLRLKYVTDMFDFRLINFPVFNVADAAITIGVIVLVYLNLFAKTEAAPETATAVPSVSPTDSRTAA